MLRHEAFKFGRTEADRSRRIVKNSLTVFATIRVREGAEVRARKTFFEFMSKVNQTVQFINQAYDYRNSNYRLALSIKDRAESH